MIYLDFRGSFFFTLAYVDCDIVWDGLASAEMCSMIPVAFVFNDSPACRGSISEIYKGKKLTNNQTVILKHPSDAAWVAKGKHGLDNIFGREAKVLRSINCENVLKCHEFICEYTSFILLLYTPTWLMCPS